MCLEYRQVNQHLATDIYPLPRLEELVYQATGHQYYVTLNTAVIDHQPLTSNFKRKTKSLARMNRWILEMREYSSDIQYVKGKDNIVADHLSRPVPMIVRSPEATWLGLDRENF